MLKLKRNKWSVILFPCRSLSGLMAEILAECMPTRDCDSNPHGDMKEVDTVITIFFFFYTLKYYHFCLSYNCINKKYLIIYFYYTFKINYHVLKILPKF